jgi:hypothetical protein
MITRSHEKCERDKILADNNEARKQVKNERLVFYQDGIRKHLQLFGLNESGICKTILQYMEFKK